MLYRVDAKILTFFCTWSTEKLVSSKQIVGRQFNRVINPKKSTLVCTLLGV